MITLSPGNPMRVVLMTVLIFEVIVYGLAIPVMIFISDVPGAAAAGFGGGTAVLALVAAGIASESGWLCSRLADSVCRPGTGFVDSDDVHCRGVVRGRVGAGVRARQAARFTHGDFAGGRRSLVLVHGKPECRRSVVLARRRTDPAFYCRLGERREVRPGRRQAPRFPSRVLGCWHVLRRAARANPAFLCVDQA